MTKTGQFPIKTPMELLSLMFMSLDTPLKTVMLSCAFILTPNVIENNIKKSRQNSKQSNFLLKLY
jgi:hypothetical protein